MKTFSTIIFLFIAISCIGQTITQNNDSANVVINVRAMDKNELISNYIIQIHTNEVTKEFNILHNENVTLILTLGKEYEIKVIIPNYTSPSYQWGFYDSKTDFRILNFQIYPDTMTEKQKLKLRKKVKKNKKIDRTCHGLQFPYRYIIE